MGPKIIFAPVGGGDWAQASISASGLPGMGDFASFSVVLPNQFRRGIKGFTLEATSTDGWLISSLSIQIGDEASKSLNLSQAGGIWLDVLEQNTAISIYKGFPYHNVWTFDDLDAFPTKGGMSHITVLDNFEKDSA
jgi:hypothetical protein